MMKKIILSIAILAITFGASFAQSNTTCPPCQVPEQCTTDGPQVKQYNAFEGLDLTDAQKAKLEELRKDSRNQLKKHKKDSKDNAFKLMQERKAADLAKIKEILTPEQYVKFLENKYLEVRPNIHKFDRKMTKDFKNDARKIGKDGKRIAKGIEKQSKAEK